MLTQIGYKFPEKERFCPTDQKKTGFCQRSPRVIHSDIPVPNGPRQTDSSAFIAIKTSSQNTSNMYYAYRAKETKKTKTQRQFRSDTLNPLLLLLPLIQTGVNTS